MAGLGVAPGMQPGSRSDYGNDQKALLNTYIHNYLVHEGHFELAKAIRSSEMSLNQQKLRKETGNNNKQQVNGADESMDMDSKDEMGNSTNKLGDTFLLDYWFIFWDMWSASKKPADKQSENAAGAYWDHQKAKKTLPNNGMMQQSMMAPNGFGGFPARAMMPNQQFNNLQKTAIANNGRNMQPQQLRMQQLAQQQQMPMDGSEVDMNGQQRPQSPMSGGENAPSPKRQRLEGGPFNGGPQMGVPGRNQMLGPLPNGAGGNPEAMRMQDPSKLSPAQLNQIMRNNPQHLYSQQMANTTKGLINNTNFPNGMANGMGQMSPMMANDPAAAIDAQMFNAGRNMGAGNGGALADYQMQLMLLEQQNKKRLMVARQENNHDRPQALIAQSGFGAPAMSPRGSRTGQSPNSNDRQRGTQGSPLPDGSMPQNTGSPAPPNFPDPSQMNLAQQFGPPNGGMIRPPVSNPMNVPNGQMNPQQLEMLQRNGRLPNGNWPNGPMPGQMGPQGAGPQQNQAEGNQQRGNMPPPQAPPASGNAGRSQPSPTQQAAAPPTPSQNNKNTKKKEGKEPKKKNTKKAQSTTGATPSADSERPPTPTPQTPITPVNPESHLIKGQQPNQPASTQSQPQTSNAPALMGMAPSQDNNGLSNQPFGALDTEMFNIGDFPALDNSDVLDAFDFDTFLDPTALGGDFADFQMPGDGDPTGNGDA